MASIGKTVWRFTGNDYIFPIPLTLADTVRSGRQASARSDAVTAAGDVGRILKASLEARFTAVN